MILRDEIYETLRDRGALTDAGLAEALGASKPSVRRARLELVREGRVRLHETARYGGAMLWVLVTGLDGTIPRSTPKSEDIKEPSNGT